MRLGGSTFSYMWKDTARNAMRELSALGLNDFDILMVPGHLWLGDDLRALKDDLNNDGARIDTLNLPSLDLNLCSVVPEVRDYAQNTFTEALQMAAELEARGVVIVPGRISGLFPPDQKATMDWLSSGTAALLERARHLGVTIFLESHPLTPIPRASDIRQFVDQFASKNLKIAYDIASAEYIGEDQFQAIIDLGDRIGQFHLSDSPRMAWRHDALGEGTVDIAKTLAAIKAIGFKDTVILEIISHHPITDNEKSIAACKQAWAQI